MKKPYFIFSFVIVLSPLSMAQTPYSQCSDEQQQHLFKQFSDLPDDSTVGFDRCLNLDPQQSTQLLALSRPTSPLKENSGEFDLKLLWVDAKKNKILQHYQLPEVIVSDADYYQDLSFDINAFSTLPNTHVVGLKIKHSHRGGFTYSNESLSLFKISPAGIQRVLSNLNVYEEGYEAIGACGANNAQSEVKRILVLRPHTHHGLQDILLKESKDQTLTNYQTCTAQQQQFKQQQILKFNGQHYQFEHAKLLERDPF